MSEHEHIHTTALTRNPDGTLHYTRDGLRALLQKLVNQTEFKKDTTGRLKTPHAPEKTFIPDAELVAHHYEDGVVDPYLTGMVYGEKTTSVDPRQYSVFQLNKVEPEGEDLEAHIRALGKGLKKYGGSKEEPMDVPLRDLVVFTPERMALHWAAILTAMYVKTNVKMPNGEPDSEKFDKWVDDRDANYVKQVNDIYHKLLGVDRTLDHRHQKETPWDGAADRANDIKSTCAEIRQQVNTLVDAFAESGFKTDFAPNTARLTLLSRHEREMVQHAVQNTQNKDTALHWVKNEIYRERANSAIQRMMEEWFEAFVFAEKSGFQKKQYVFRQQRESFVLSGGSATGKSLPMSLVCEKIAKGYDPESDIAWKRGGMDLNDAVHMKSEVMRSLLLEEDFLKYGNRLFFDESAHDERRVIRDEMFKYLGKMLNEQCYDINRNLAPRGMGPIIIHDRRSTYHPETETLISDGARLNYFYFNLPADQALVRNLGRGTADLARLNDPNAKIDVNTYAPRFVNARNNIGSQASSAQRMMEMFENFAGRDIIMPLYSTKAPKEALPPVFGYADLKDRTLHIRRLPRLIDTIDNSLLKIPEKQATRPKPLSKEVHDLIDHDIDDPKKRHLSHAEDAADWLVGLVKKHGYHVFISTPPECDKVDDLSATFAEVYRKPSGKVRFAKTNKVLYEDVQFVPPNEKAEGADSRYKTFLDQLESKTKENKNFEGLYEVPHTRIKPLLLSQSQDFTEGVTSQPKGRL